MLITDNVWAQIDDDPHYMGEEHIWPSKYDTRESVIRRTYDAFEDMEIISICGNGATSLAKKLSIRFKGRVRFPEVAMVTVPPNPNLEKIRRGIVQQIGGTQIGNCLLILDGFWRELNNEDFQTIGIPSPSKNFKMIFTSRNEEMCKIIGRHQIHHIDLLEDEEAWDLFQDIAGKSVVTVNETARKIVDACDGSRIAILIIASALKDKPVEVWKDSLKSLQFLYGTIVSDVNKVFSWINLSYSLLVDMEANLMFLICCLFPEDFNIPVEDLLLFWKGLKLFENVDCMNQARDRVECIVHNLKKAYFLLNGDEDDFVKVHGVHHDFGVSLCSKLMHPYVIRCENTMKEWPQPSLTMRYGNCRAISFMCKIIEQHPVDLECPNLHLLQLSYESDSARLPNGMFEGLQNLRVLSLSIPSLSQSLSMLKKLRTLCITESKSENSYTRPRPRIGDLIGDEMEDLEIFSFSTARPYCDFPREIGVLHNLRYLRFNQERLKYIPPGVLSKLEKLEELHLPRDFISWGCKEEGGERINASLSEIESLPLTSLTIGTFTGSVLAEKLIKKLTRFRVFISSHVSVEYEFGTWGNSKRLLEVFDVDAGDFTASWVRALVWKSESLRLKQVRNLKNIITWQWELAENRIPQWKKICISDCRELEYLVEGQVPWTSFSHLESLKLFGLYNMKELWHGLRLSKFEGSYFCNLGEIEIMFCRKLKSVLPVSVAVELRQLQSLQICFCDKMEDIFHREQTNDCSIQVASSSMGEENAYKGKIQMRDPTVETTPTSKPIVNTKIHHKSKLISLTSNTITKRLFGRRKLQKIVTPQQQMEENIGKEEHPEIIFPQLKTMEFAYMSKLRVFYNGNHSIVLPSLQSLSIFRCDRLEAFSYGLLKTPLLQQIQVDGNRCLAAEELNTILKNIYCSRIDHASNHETRTAI